MAKKELGGLDYILRICSLYIIVWTISPPLQYPTIFRICAICAGSVWVLLSWFSIAYEKTDLHGVYIAVCAFCVLTIFIEWVCGSSIEEAIINRLQTIILLLFVLQYMYYKDYDAVFIKQLTVITIICLSVWQIRTLIEYQTNPGVSRLLVRSSDEAQYYASKGVGGYGLVYPSVFINIALMHLIGRVKGFKKIFVLIPLLIGVLLVFSSGFLIAVIMTLVSLGAWAVRMFGNKNIKTIIISIICLTVVIFIVMELLLKYSDSIVNALDGTFYKVKIQEIINALKDDHQVTGKLEGRTSRYLESITGIFKYPVIGAKFLGLESELGGHSTLLDVLGLYGIFSIGFYFAIYFAIKNMYKMAEHKGFIIAVIILFILNGVLNTFVGSHGIIFVVIPGVILLGNKEK